MTPEPVDALVIGGGLYGCWIARFLRRAGLKRVVLVEQESEICTRASFWNQARIHNGYHYPRSFQTAWSSRVNLPRFVADFPDTIVDVTSLYAIARSGSKVTPRGFRAFCGDIGARIEPAPHALNTLFSPRLIAGVFLAEEPVFDARRLADQLLAALKEDQVELRLGTKITGVRSEGGLAAVTVDGQIPAQRIFNCTYAGLDALRSPSTSGLKYEAVELALIEPPDALRGVGVTVMDGPFFSTLPFPPRDLHSLSHVRYTPHIEWTREETNRSPYEILDALPKKPRARAMLRDAARYMPVLGESRIVDSFFEVKAVRQANEGDDGRPILFEPHPEHPGCFSVLGGKLDNIYDVEEVLRRSLRTEVG